MHLCVGLTKGNNCLVRQKEKKKIRSNIGDRVTVEQSE